MYVDAFIGLLVLLAVVIAAIFAGAYIVKRRRESIQQRWDEAKLMQINRRQRKVAQANSQPTEPA